MDFRSYQDVFSVEGDPRPEPADLTHHLSEVTKRRVPSQVKASYSSLDTPGVANLLGGMPNVQYFPFDTLEAQTARPERWSPTPNYPNGGGQLLAGLASETPASDQNTAFRIGVPKSVDEADPVKKIDLATALQYGTAQGYPPLQSWIRQFTRHHLHPNVPYRGGPEVILTCGNNDGFSKTLGLFVNAWIPGLNDVRERPGMLCEVFAYSAALTQTRPLGIQTVAVHSDSKGMLASGPGGLEDVLSNWDDSKGKRPHLLYSVSMGHNPMGFILPLSRRKELYAICSKYDVIIIEDDPYWYLQFPSVPALEAESRNQPPPPPPEAHNPEKSSGYTFLDSLTPSFLSVDTDGRVVRLDTFSKTIAPGCRLGWITAQPKLMNRFLWITESSTQQPSGFVQSMVAELAMGPQPPAVKAAFAALRTDKDRAAFTGWKVDGWVRWLAGLRGAYERRVVRMCRVLDEGSTLAHIARPPLSPPPSSSSSSSSLRLRSRSHSHHHPVDWAVVEKTRLYDYTWPRGGMFVWLRVNFEKHPLWGVSRTLRADHCGRDDGRLIDGDALSGSLPRYLSRKPYLVAVGLGIIFSATDQIGAEEGWAHFRICFAAEADENIEPCSRRFVAGVHEFWRIDADELEDLLDDGFTPDGSGDGVMGLGNLSSWYGC